MVQNNIEGMSNWGAVITWSIDDATTEAVIRKYPDAVGDINLDSLYWEQSLFRIMGFSRCRKTSTKVDLPESAQKAIEYFFFFLYESVLKVEQNAIPDSLITNLDQTPLKMVQCGNNTLVKKTNKTVTIVGAEYKRSIRATFSITLSGNFSNLIDL